MAQLTIFKPDNSCADIILISDSLHKVLFKFAQLFELEHLNLDYLKEIKHRVLSVASISLNNKDCKQIENLASDSFDWFDELLEAISQIENLSNPNSLCICLSS